MNRNSAKEISDNSVINNIAQAFNVSNIISNAVASILVWLISIILATSFSALIFQGRLASYYGAGIGIALVSATIISFFVAVFGSDHATISYPQSTAAAILGTMTFNIAETAPKTMPDEILFATIVLTISLASLLTGLFFLILGVLRAGNLIRYIPYPIIGGFLAGSGWLLIQGALTVMVNLKISSDTLLLLVNTPVIERWLPGVILAFVLLGVMRHSDNVLWLPAVIIGALILFYAALFSIGGNTSIATNRAWFLEEISSNVLWQLPDFSLIPQIDATFILAQSGSMAAVIIISTLHFLLNSSGLELIVDRELDLNRELTITGAANALSGIVGGGIIGFPSVTFSTLAHRTGAYGRIIGVVLSVLLGLTLFIGASLITVFPRVILGGLLMYLGLNFLVEWLYDEWFKLPRKDYLIMLVIFLVITIFGFLEGVAVGIIATVILFVLEYSQISIVKQEFSGRVFRSNIDRSFEENALLRDLGQYIWILRLQGFIFFGTSHQFFHRIKARVLDPEQEALLFVIVDFRMVRGIDVSTVMNFTKLKRLAEIHGFHVLFTDVAPHLHEVLQECGFGSLDTDVLRQFSDLDHAMEWCENDLLTHADLSVDKTITLQKQFESRTMTRVLDVSTLSKYLERVDVEVGEYIVHQNDEPDSLYFIESGRVDIQLDLDHHKPVRLRSMRAGTVVGEVGFYLGRPRSASIVVAEKGVFYQLTRDALYKMSEDDPEAASSFHVFIACIVSERLSATNHMLEALLD